MFIHSAAHYATIADAYLLQPTVSVRVALHRNFSAVNLGIPFKVGWAATFGRVADGLAVCVHPADTRSARVLAKVVSTLQEEVAVTVCSASSDTPGVVADFSSVAVIVRGTEVGW